MTDEMQVVPEREIERGTEDRSLAFKRGIESATRKAKEVGGKIAHVVSEVPELVSLQRNDRALRSEMDDELKKIGKGILNLHKRSRGRSPFLKYKTVMKHLENLDGLEKEYRSNKIRLNTLREELRGKGRS